MSGKIVTTALDQLTPGGGEKAISNGRIQMPPRPSGVTGKQLMRDVLVIAWPSLIEMILTQLTSIADQIMVGRMPGEAGITGLSAVGLAMQPKFLLMTMVLALNIGATAVIARYRGQQNQEKAQQAFRQVLLLNGLVSTFFMILGLTIAPQLIHFMSGNGIGQQTMAEATRYLRIQLYGFLPLALTFTVTAALRGIGDSKIPMLYNTLANALNLAFNYVMIYGKWGLPAMGVAGAAWATVIGQTAAFVVAMAVVCSGRHYIHFNIRKIFCFDGAMMLDVLHIGIPAMVEQIFMRVGIMLYTRTVAGLGDTLYATHQICMSIQAFSFMVGQAFASATTTLMGQSLGRQRQDMAVIYMRCTRNLGIVVSAAMGLMMILLNGRIVSLYNPNEAVIQAGSGILVLIGLSQPIQADQFIVSGGLRGAGDTRYTAFVVLITTLFVRSLLGMLMVQVLNWGLWGAWIALMADQCLRTGLMAVRYRTGKWMMIWDKNRNKE